MKIYKLTCLYDTNFSLYKLYNYRDHLLYRSYTLGILNSKVLEKLKSL